MDAQFVRLTIALGVLEDETFLATCLNENTPDRQVIYEIRNWVSAYAPT